MAFWTESGGKDPKRNFRFKVTITGFQRSGVEGSQSVVWWAKKVTKPNFTVAESKHVYLGHSFYWPGKVEWQPISMTMVDPVDPNSAHILLDIIEKSGYVLPKTSGLNKTMSKKNSVASTGLGAVQIDQLNGDGEVIETWTLNNAFIKSLKFGDLDYENDDLSQIEMELRYDWASCDPDGTETAATTFFGA